MTSQLPELRFKGFSGDWEEKKLGDVFSFSISNNSISRANLNYKNGDIKNIHYGDVLINYKSILNTKLNSIPYINNSSIEKYKGNFLKNGDIVFADAAEDETVGKAVEIDNVNNDYVVAGLHTIASRPKKEMGKYYWGFYINSNSYHRQLLRLIQGSKVSSINKGNLKNSIVKFPKNEEQQKIGTFFKQLDDTIELYQKQLNLVKKQKKGFLQKMFPKDGEQVPELRFKGFNGDWEEKQLKNIIDVRDGTHESPKPQNEGYKLITSKNLKNGKIDMKNAYYISKSDYIKINNRSKVEIGDILFGMIGTIGNPIVIQNDEFAIKNVALLKTSTFKGNFYLLNYLKSHLIKKQFHKFNAGGTQKFISLNVIRNLNVLLPDNEEQQKIGAFFKQLDENIELLENKLIDLNKLKKGFLQKMFV